ALVIAICSVILFLLCFSWTRERVTPTQEQRSTLKEDIRDLWHNGPWWILLGASIMTLLFNSVRDGAALYYFKYYVQEEMFGNIYLFRIPFVLSGLYLAVGQIPNIIGVIAAAPLSNKIGKKATFVLAMGIATLGSVAFFWLESQDLWGIFGLHVVISICAGTVFPLLWSMYADFGVHSAYVTGNRAIGRIFGLQDVISICAGTVFPLLLSMYADCGDYSAYVTGNRATGLIFSSSSMSQKLG